MYTSAMAQHVLIVKMAWKEQEYSSYILARHRDTIVDVFVALTVFVQLSPSIAGSGHHLDIPIALHMYAVSM